MNLLSNLIHGLKSLFLKPRVDRELDEELQSYFEASTADKRRAGIDSRIARRLARVEMGSPGSVKHQVWTSRWESTLDSLLQDTRLSLRSLAKSPGFTLVALLSLALGIGANTAIFTLIHQVLLRNLPVQHPEQLVTFGSSVGGGINGGVDIGFNDLFTWDFARQLEADPGPFQSVAAYSSFAPRVSVRDPDSGSTNSPAAQLSASMVSGNYFATIGATPILGRTILPSDVQTPGSSAVVVIGNHYWQQELSSDPNILGKSISVNGTPFRVIGVMPSGFFGIKPDVHPPDLWVPITMDAQIFLQPDFLAPRATTFLHMFARRQSSAMGSGDLKETQLWFDQQVRTYIRAGEGAVIPADRQLEIKRISVPLLPGAHGVNGLGKRYGDSLKVLMVVVALVLLIACANLANFLLARAAQRQREIATRLALGSSRGRIIRQSLIETLLLSLTGGAAGLALAFAATRALIAFVSQGAEHISIDSTPDATALLFTLAVSMVTALLFGLAPALAAARTNTTLSLSSNARTAQSSGGRASRFWPKTLVTAQVMLSLLLLVGAGLFLRTLNNLQNQDYGFERTHLLLAVVEPTIVGYKPSQAPALNQQLLDHLSTLPGVRSVALSATPPISGGNWSSSFKPQGYTPAPKETVWSPLNRVTDRYFETTGIALVAGRSFNSADTLSSLKVTVVNQTLAKRYYPKGDAIGRLLTIDSEDIKGPWRIVGIAHDTKSGDPRNTKTDPMIYFPLAQMPPFDAPDPAAPGAPLEENQSRFATTSSCAPQATRLRSSASSAPRSPASIPTFPSSRYTPSTKRSTPS